MQECCPRVEKMLLVPPYLGISGLFVPGHLELLDRHRLSREEAFIRHTVASHKHTVCRHNNLLHRLRPLTDSLGGEAHEVAHAQLPAVHDGPLPVPPHPHICLNRGHLAKLHPLRSLSHHLEQPRPGYQRQHHQPHAHIVPEERYQRGVELIDVEQRPKLIHTRLQNAWDLHVDLILSLHSLCRMRAPARRQAPLVQPLPRPPPREQAVELRVLVPVRPIKSMPLGVCCKGRRPAAVGVTQQLNLHHARASAQVRHLADLV
mmetsp:Transcript_43093/g.105126  ORF Transcript_43093/g.105126 Transcript_43093/m.105126 type:complete len:261 (+) Transcript_43093:1213-1995(+)